MNKTSFAQAQPVSFTGCHDNILRGEIYRGDTGKPPVLLAHGGGQTRHSWKGTAAQLAAAGYTAVIIDQRGHGDSDWQPDGFYDFAHFAADLREVASQLFAQFARRPVIVGASLGGIAALLAEGEDHGHDHFSAIVLVDITTRLRREGVEKILGFMGEKANEGFASLEEAADAIAAYLPHRPRPQSLDGLAKNLRRGADGRYRWHWDPAFIRRAGPDADFQAHNSRMDAAARQVAAPLLLVRGRESELVSEADAAHLLSLIPGAQYVDVSGAGHMIAGDRNDVFTDAVMDFLRKLPAPRAQNTP
ncbi:alpha/beta hydrolase [Granulosicoccaceae sp. 1_MG-2023]|nr:alpha/beta hydrolase [Granulosicoccaceae sp. 1_MG-2023]